MDASTLSNLYGTDYNIVYDVQSNLTVQDLSGNYGQSYFDGFGENCVVIIEFKNIFADTTELDSIFFNLKTRRRKDLFASASRKSQQRAYRQYAHCDENFKLFHTMLLC